jgi:hypothetical protein
MANSNSVPLADDSIVVTSGRQTSIAVGTEQAILQLDSGQYFGLNRVGSRVWQLIAKPQPVKVVLATLLAEFDVPEERCRADLFALLEQLRAAQLIEVKSN